MWAFTYQGDGVKEAENTEHTSDFLARVDAMEGKVQELAEKQMVDKPAEAIPLIRAAAAAVKELAKGSDGKVQIVAEGWVEKDGQASTTINVVCYPVAAPASS